MRPAVIGVGNEWRSDDGVGPAAVAALTDRLPGEIDLLTLDGEPTRLVEAWDGRPWVIVVDAVRSGELPGVIHQVDGADLGNRAGSVASSHGGGVDMAVALGRTLGRLPNQLIVLGIEAATTEHGNERSAPVAAAFGCLLHRIERLVAEQAISKLEEPSSCA